VTDAEDESGPPARSSLQLGQSLAEFALVLVPLVLLLLGAVQFGVIWATQIAVTNAVRDAARAASIAQPKNGDYLGTVDTTSEAAFANSILAGVLMPALQNNVPFYSAASATTKQICYQSFLDAQGGTSLQAKVTLTYEHPIFIPLVASVLGGSALSTTATLTIPVGLESPYVLPSAGTSGCST
jgi:Flp pilus assembly protein TadG